MPKYYQVSKVLAVRTVNGDKEYLLRWKGYGSKADSCVKEEDCNSAIKNCAALSLEGELIVRMNFVFSSLLFLLVVTCFLLFIPARKKSSKLSGTRDWAEVVYENCSGKRLRQTNNRVGSS